MGDGNSPPPAPAGPAAYCRACAYSGCGACDDYPNCPAGRARERTRADNRVASRLAHSYPAKDKLDGWDW